MFQVERIRSSDDYDTFLDIINKRLYELQYVKSVHIVGHPNGYETCYIVKEPTDKEEEELERKFR